MSAAAAKMPDIIEVTEDPIVSSDVIRNRHSLVFDSKATMKTAGKLVKTIGWYDNGWGHAARLLDVILDYEDEFDKEVEDEDAHAVNTVGDAVELIQAKIA
jgi:glyceraldehyde 3-phosphate dehydrogenase